MPTVEERLQVIEDIEAIRRLPEVERVGTIRIQTASAMRADQVIVDHRPQVFFRHQFEAVDLMRGAESVEEVDEWQPRLERCRVRDQGHVLRFLD